MSKIHIFFLLLLEFDILNILTTENYLLVSEINKLISDIKKKKSH